MAQPPTSAFTQVTPDAIATLARDTFAGWHFTAPGAVQRTAYCCLPPRGQMPPRGEDPGTPAEEFRRGVAAMRRGTPNAVVCICSPPEGAIEPLRRATMRRFASVLDNNGATIQQKPGSMALTRPLRVLVKGPGAAHAATPCDVRGWVVFTPAFNLVQSMAVQAIVTESQKFVAGAHAHRCLARMLEPDRATGGASRAMSALAREPTFETLFSLNTKLPPEPCVLLTQATAILVTGYEDAGAKFR